MTAAADARLSSIDWTQRDVDIAKSLGLSRERVRQIRIGTDAPRSPFQQISKEGIRLIEWIEYFRSTLSGRVTQREFLAFSGTTLSDNGAARIAGGYNFKFCSLKVWYKRLGINLQLPNVDLERIWGLSDNLVGNARYRYGLRGPRWNIQGGGRPNDPLYRRAILEEIVRVRAVQLGDFPEEQTDE